MPKSIQTYARAQSNLSQGTLSLEHHFRFNVDCSVLHSEIFAILKAIKAIGDGPALDSESYAIFVDSQAVLRAIVSVWCKSRLVREYKESLRMFVPDRIRLCWVPCYSGILAIGADALARLDLLSRGDLLGGPDPPICHF